VVVFGAGVPEAVQGEANVRQRDMNVCRRAEVDEGRSSREPADITSGPATVQRLDVGWVGRGCAAGRRHPSSGDVDRRHDHTRRTSIAAPISSTSTTCPDRPDRIVTLCYVPTNTQPTRTTLYW